MVGVESKMNPVQPDTTVEFRDDTRGLSSGDRRFQPRSGQIKVFGIGTILQWSVRRLVCTQTGCIGVSIFRLGIVLCELLYSILMWQHIKEPHQSPILQADTRYTHAHKTCITRPILLILLKMTLPPISTHR